MSIDYFGHSTREVADAQSRIAHARAAHPEWFDSILLLCDAKPPDKPFGREISRAFGVEAKSWFMLSVNDKDRFDECLADALEFLYEIFGTDTLTITWGLDMIKPALRPHRGIDLP
jgi:hypothetical protein